MLHKNKLEIKEISATLIGEVGYTTTESDTDSDGNSTSKAEYHDIEFYSTKFSLIKPESGQK